MPDTGHVREFWTNVGYGFIRSANHNTNRILDPISVIDFRLGQGDFEILPDIEIYKEYQDNKLVFLKGTRVLIYQLGYQERFLAKCFIMMSRWRVVWKSSWKKFSATTRIMLTCLIDV